MGFTKTTRDFSARRAVESALRHQLERAVDPQAFTSKDFERVQRQVADLSHELRTPLNAILGSLALMSDSVANGDPNRAHVDRMLRNSRHLLAIVEDVLQLARTGAGVMKLSSGKQRLGPVTEEALADIEPQARARGVEIVNSVSGAASDLPFFGDQNRVRQILVNLLSNAVKFTEPGGHVMISGGTGETVTGADLPGSGPWLYVRVEDTGRGIAPGLLDAIFEPFRQSMESDQRRGSGLGLSISRQFARAMNGDIVAESEVGIGSTFTLWLPIAEVEPVPR